MLSLCNAAGHAFRLLEPFVRHDEPVERVALRLDRRVAEHPGELAIDPRHAFLKVEHYDGLGRTFEQLVEQRGLNAQSLLGLFSTTQFAQHQPHEQHHAQTQDRGTHRAVRRLDVPCLQHGGLLHAGTNRDRETRHRQRGVYFFAAVDRARQECNRRLRTPKQFREYRLVGEGSAGIGNAAGMAHEQAAVAHQQADLAAGTEV